MEHRKLPFERVKAGVVAKRTFGSHLPEFDVPLEYDLGIRRDFEINRLTRHQFHRIVPQEAREKKLVHIRRYRQYSGKAGGRIRADRDGNLEPSSLILRARAPKMLG